MKSTLRKDISDGVQVLAVFVFEDLKTDYLKDFLDKDALDRLEEIKKLNDFSGKKMEQSLIYAGNSGFSRILLVGLGAEKDLNIETLKKAFGSAVIFSQNKKVSKMSLVFPEILTKKFEAGALGSELTCVVKTASYSFDNYLDKEAKITKIKEADFVLNLPKIAETAFKKGMKKGEIIGDAVNYTRHLGNIPPTVMTPTYLAKEAQKLSKNNENLKAKILSRPEMEKLGMGCLLGVARGSEEEPKFIILEYTGAPKSKKPTVLVGKGITFDSGGLSLKPADYMGDMKFDMLGGATVFGIIKAVSELKLKKNLVGLVPSAENMPSGTAYRPDDILVAMNGKSVEIGNTDAEGRLILADALCYAKKYEPKEVIDFATLTGACVVALGNERSGLFSDNEDIVNELLHSSQSVGERLWRLPLGEEYSEAIKSDVADIKNIGGVGGGRYGGASTAAAFLQFFTDYPWAHIDLSCSHFEGKGKPWIRGGANGFGVETLVEYIRGKSL